MGGFLRSCFFLIKGTLACPTFLLLLDLNAGEDAKLKRVHTV